MHSVYADQSQRLGTTNKPVLGHVLGNLGQNPQVSQDLRCCFDSYSGLEGARAVVVVLIFCVWEIGHQPKQMSTYQDRVKRFITSPPKEKDTQGTLGVHPFALAMPQCLHKRVFGHDSAQLWAPAPRTCPSEGVWASKWVWSVGGYFVPVLGCVTSLGVGDALWLLWLPSTPPSEQCLLRTGSALTTTLPAVIWGLRSLLRLITRPLLVSTQVTSLFYFYHHFF